MTHAQFIGLVEKMRAAQVAYIRRLTAETARDKSQLEAQVDAEIRRWRKENEEKQGELWK